MSNNNQIILKKANLEDIDKEVNFIVMFHSLKMVLQTSSIMSYIKINKK